MHNFLRFEQSKDRLLKADGGRCSSVGGALFIFRRKLWLQAKLRRDALNNIKSAKNDFAASLIDSDNNNCFLFGLVDDGTIINLPYSLTMNMTTETRTILPKTLPENLFNKYYARHCRNPSVRQKKTNEVRSPLLPARPMHGNKTLASLRAFLTEVLLDGERILLLRFCYFKTCYGRRERRTIETT